MIEQVSSYGCRAPDYPFVSLDVRVTEIADRAGLRVETWEEDGLGPASGMFVKLPSGTVVLLRELEHLVEHRGARGPTVYTTADKVVASTVESLVAEVLESLALPKDTISWTADESVREYAAAMVEHWQSWQHRHPNSP
jgi:hypothetical protein